VLGSKVAAVEWFERRGCGKRRTVAGDGMDCIKHLVVVMMENRSFENLLGFLLCDVNNRPAINIPAPPAGWANDILRDLVAPKSREPVLESGRMQTTLEGKTR